MFECFGVDIYLRSETTPDLPKEIGKCKLIFISNRGTKCWPVAVEGMNLIDWPRARYESTAPMTDSEVNEVVVAISDANFHWTKTQKLYRKDGENQYSQPY